MTRRWLEGVLGTVLLVFIGVSEAHADDEPVVRWSRDPGLVPWETMTTSGDPDRTPARTREDLQRRRHRVNTYLEGEASTAEERAVALAELGDLFRDEARLVLQDDASDPWRIPLRTSPAWLQLEFALRWYGEAVQADPGAVDDDGRLTLLRAVLASRLGEGETFDDYVRVIRSYRGTPYVEMAKLAVGDHHFRTGDLDRARSAYRMVRTNRDPELSGYADYRLASVYAAQGEPDKALEILADLVEREQPGPLTEMLRDAARSAMANHLAADRDLLDLLPWLHDACPVGDPACERDLRAAASDTYARRGDVRADAWLRTVDALPQIRADESTRLSLARRLLAEEPPEALLFAVEDTCARDDDPCRAEAAHAVSTYFEEVADPAGAWLQSYVRLPRLPERPDVQPLAARIARDPRPPEVELAEAEALCSDDACARTLRTHLRVVWGRLDRLHDAAWLHFVDEAPPVPGPPDAELLAGRLVRTRAPAREMLAELAPGCDGERACIDELYEILVGYYAAVGMEREASWLIALKMLPELPIPTDAREALRAAALRGDDGRQTLRALLETCPAVEPACFETSRVAAEAFLRASARHADAVVVADLGVLTQRALDPAAFPVLVDLVLDEAPAATALESLETACTGRPERCGPDARRVLATWFEDQSRHADARAVRRLDAAPDLDPYGRLAPAFLRVARTAPDPRQARERVEALCPPTAASCPEILREALATWYEVRGRTDDARAVRGP